MSNQLYSDGEVINVNGTELECVSVAYQETPEGDRFGHVYGFRLKSELDAERELKETNVEEGAEDARQ